MPNFHEPFVDEYDASGRGIGDMLMQNDRLIAFLSKALKGKNLVLLTESSSQVDTYKRKLSTLLWGCKDWEPYLLVKEFLIRSDHQSYKYWSSEQMASNISWF